MTKNKDFPKVMFIHQEEDSGTKYFIADAELDAHVEMNDKIKVAEYHLQSVLNVKGSAEVTD